MDKVITLLLLPLCHTRLRLLHLLLYRASHFKCVWGDILDVDVTLYESHLLQIQFNQSGKLSVDIGCKPTATVDQLNSVQNTSMFNAASHVL